MLKIPFYLWDKQGEGYVSISSNDPTTTGSWDEEFYKWPKDKHKLLPSIIKAQELGRDVYFGLAVYKEPTRNEDVVNLNMLWADLDKRPGRVPMTKINPKPTMLWESSPGNYQAVWLLNESLDNEQFNKINRELTYTLGADKGCWNISRVFRVPGSINFKRGAEGEQGKVIQATKAIYDVKSFIHTKGAEVVIGDVEDEPELDLRELLYPYKRKIIARTWELLNTPMSEATRDRDRSARLWELQRLLEEAKVPKDKVRLILEQSVWNKFAGRHDETVRLDNQIEKTDGLEEGIKNEQVDRECTSYSELMGKKVQKERWLVENWWAEDSHGFVSGQPKTFKSVLTTDFAASVASGEPFLGCKVHKQGPVLIIQEENSEWIMQDRMRKVVHSKGLLEGQADVNGNIIEASFPPDLPLYFLNNKGFCLTEAEDKLHIEKQIIRIKPVLVIFDPLYLMLGDADENSSKDLRPILVWLKSLHFTYNTAVMVVHHYKKSSFSKRGGQKMLGSALLHAFTESAFYLDLKEDGVVSVEREFRGYAKPPRCKINIEMSEPGELMYRTEVEVEDSVYEKIRGLYSANSFTTDEARAVTGCGPKKTGQLLEKLAKEKEIRKVSESGKGRGNKETWEVIR